MTSDVNNLRKKLDKFTLKWLWEVGPVRRKEILRKIKDQLRKLESPKTKLNQAVNYGPKQLMTKCFVSLERLPSNYALGCFHKSQDSLLYSNRISFPDNTEDSEIRRKKNHTSCKKNEIFKRKATIVTDVPSTSKKAFIPPNCSTDKIHSLTETDSLSNKLFIPETVPNQKNKNLKYFSANIDCENISSKSKNELRKCVQKEKVEFSEGSLLEEDSTNDSLAEKSFLDKLSSQTKKETKVLPSRKDLPPGKKFHPLTEKPVIAQKSDEQKKRFTEKISSQERNPFFIEENSLRNTEKTYSEKENLKKESNNEKETHMRKSTFASSSDEKSYSMNKSELVEKFDPSRKSKDSRNFRIALPVRINLESIKLDKISKSEILNLNSKTPDVRLNTSEFEKTIERKKITRLENQEENPKMGESTITQKIENRKKNKRLKLVFRELFGDDGDQNLDFEKKKRKINSPNSCGPRNNDFEAPSIPIIDLSEDLDPLEISSPKFTEIKQRNKEINCNLPTKIPSFQFETSDTEDKMQIDQNSNLRQKENTDADETNDGENFLPDSSTSFSEDELQIFEYESQESTVLKENEKIDSETRDEAGILKNREFDSNIVTKNISDSLNIKIEGQSVGIENIEDSSMEVEAVEELPVEVEIERQSVRRETVENQPKESEISRDLPVNVENVKDLPVEVKAAEKLPVEVEIKSETVENQPKDSEISEEFLNLETVEDLPETEAVQNQPVEPETVQNQPKIVDIVKNLPKSIPNQTMDPEISTEPKIAENKQVADKIIKNQPKPLPPQISIPKLRVKSPQELGSSNWHPTSPPPITLTNPMLLNPEINPNYSPLTELFSLTVDPLPASTSAFKAPFPKPRLPPPYPGLTNSNHTLRPNQEVNSALPVAQQLTSIINPSAVPNHEPDIFHYYNSLIIMLGDIANHTISLRCLYRNRPLGLCSHDLLSFNLALNYKLQTLAKILQVSFQKKTMELILNHYHRLTRLPILDIEELNYIMSLQYREIRTKKHHSLPVNNLSPAPNQIIQPVNQFFNQNFRAIQPKQISQPIRNVEISQEQKSLTIEQQISLKAQINDYNTLIFRFNSILMVRQLEESKRKAETKTRQKNIVESEKIGNENILECRALNQNSTVVFRKKNTKSPIIQVNKEDKNLTNSGSDPRMILMIQELLTPVISNPTITESVISGLTTTTSTASTTSPNIIQAMTTTTNLNINKTTVTEIPTITTITSNPTITISNISPVKMSPASNVVQIQNRNILFSLNQNNKLLMRDKSAATAQPKVSSVIKMQNKIKFQNVTKESTGFIVPNTKLIVPTVPSISYQRILPDSTEPLPDFDKETEFRSMPSLSPLPTSEEPKNPILQLRAENLTRFKEENLSCHRCNKKSIVLCGRCQKVHYCSKLCQEIHWETNHHETCQEMEENCS